MSLEESHKGLIDWYRKKLDLSEYGVLWLVYFKNGCVALIYERLILN
tara:strand:- start:202 stop:342 length:141 start_codon:yes stop_codon:yes gene_type:complete